MVYEELSKKGICINFFQSWEKCTRSQVSTESVHLWGILQEDVGWGECERRGVGVGMEVSSHLNTCDIFIFLAFSCVVVVFVLIRWNLA